MRVFLGHISPFRAKSSFEIDNVACLKDIELACGQQRVSDNLFYALRLDGIFETIHARAVHAIPQNIRLLDAAKNAIGVSLREHRRHARRLLVSALLEFLQRPRISSSLYFEGPNKRRSSIELQRTQT